MTERTRRQLLAGIGTSLTLATAGCSGNSDSGGDNNSTDSSGDGLSGRGSDVFDEFSFEQYTLNISLATTDGYDEIVAFDSDGKQFASTSVTPSAGQVSLDFSGYSPGEYRFAAVNSDDDSVVSEVTEVLEPNIELVDWQTASEAGMYSPEDRSAVTDIVLTIENTGNAPEKLIWIGYESEQFTPKWSEGGDPEPVGYSGDATPDSQVQSLSNNDILAYHPDFKSDRHLPVQIYAGERVQLIDGNNRDLLTAGMDQDESIIKHEDTAGWSVQEGVKYDFTVTVGAKYSERKSLTKTVTWERMGRSEVMTNQPADSLITTNRTEDTS